MSKASPASGSVQLSSMGGGILPFQPPSGVCATGMSLASTIV